MTNLEKIRQMSDEEIAERIRHQVNWSCDYCIYHHTKHCMYSIWTKKESKREIGGRVSDFDESICFKGTKAWLNSEVKEC